MFSIPTLLGDAQQRRSLHDSDVKGGYLESFPNSLPTTNDDSGKIPMLLYPDAHAYLQAKLLFEQTLKSSNKNVINDAEPSLENFLMSLKQVQQLANFSHLAKHLKESLTLNSNSFKLSCPAQADKIDPESGDSGREYGDEDIEIDDNSDCERDDFKASSERAITASGSGCFDPNNSNSKRRRTSFNSVQLLQLEREFLSKKYLSLNERAELARTLKLSQEQIKVWFQNRRAKWKRSKGYRSTQARGGDADASANNSSDGDAHHSSMVTPTSGGGGGGHNSSHKIHVPIPVHVDRVRLRSQQQQIEKQQQRYISASHQQTANTSHIESAVPQHSSLQQAFDLLESRYPGGSLLAQPSSTMISTYLARYELLPSPNSAFQIVRR